MIATQNKRLAVVTGAGSGIGRAVALALAKSGWRVAIIGRRTEALNETVALSDSKDSFYVRPCDIGDPIAVGAMAASVIKPCNQVQALVNAAGVNIPKRRLEELTEDDFEQVVRTNLYGAYFCVRAFLPFMRRDGGTIINISSEAGRQASAKSGAAYVVSKFGLSGLTQSINAEERSNNIRASCIFPGDVATPLLDQRPVPPPHEARMRMLQPDDVSACVLLALNLPPRAVVEELVVRPLHLQ